MRRSDRGENLGRRGGLLLDAAAATALVAVALGLTLQLIVGVAAQRRAADQRQFALQTASNVIEHMLIHAHHQKIDGSDSVVLDPLVGEVLPRASAIVTTSDEADAEGLQRLTVEITWQARVGDPPARVRLSAWVARAAGGAP